jgi:hypothetical protein
MDTFIYDKIKNIMEINDPVYCENIDYVEPLPICLSNGIKIKINDLVCQNLSSLHDKIIITFHNMMIFIINPI